MRARLPLAALLSLLVQGCFPGISLDAPALFTESDWSQHGGSPRREHHRGGALVPPLEMYWEHSTSGTPGSPEPLIAGGSVYVTSVVGGVDVFDVLTGDRRGDIPVKASIHGTPAGSGQYLMLPLAHDEPSLLCIDGTARKLFWQRDLKAIDASLLIVDGSVVAATLGGEVHCIRIRDSLPQWTAELPGSVYGSPVAADSLVIVPCADGDVYALSAQTGARRWRIPTGAPILSSPACSGRSVAAANTRGDVVCVNLADGGIRWRRTLRTAIYSGLAADDSCVYVPGADGTLYALMLADGAIRWKFHDRSPLGAAPLIVDGTVTVVFMNGTLSILEKSSGALLWSADAGARIRTAPVFSNGILIVCTEDRNVIGYGRKR
jgi:eukaryotic-like serine/threonine-protein kinase